MSTTVTTTMPATIRPGDVPAEVDVVVIGAGHNSLACAAYLASAGLEVLVLEAEAQPGGNTRTEQLTLPGYANDSCSSAHVVIQNNPLIRDDELGLVSKYGLTYLKTDPAVVMPQEDGEVLVIHRDLSGTVDEIARWSSADARAFEAMIVEWRDQLAPVHGRWNSLSPLGDGDAANRYRELHAVSAWDVVHKTFEHPVVRAFALWMGMANIQDPRKPGTGYLPAALTAGRIAHGWTTPVGGSQALPNALIRLIKDHGGHVACSAPVVSVLADSSGARGVRIANGQEVRARRAVVAGGHLAALGKMLEGTEETADLRKARENWRPGLSVAAVHAALRSDLAFGPAGISAAAAGFATPEGIVAHLDRFGEGDYYTSDPWLLIVNQTAVDPSRGPGDGGGTFKILTIAPWELSGDRKWADVKDEYGAAVVDFVGRRCVGLSRDDILFMRTESPLDVAAHNPQNLLGSCHGGEFSSEEDGIAPGWRRFDTDVPGLFLTGSTSHPGGSVSGWPGRNTARVVLQAVGIDPARVMGGR
jgi:phytoene dehydrogenase-like protein